MKNETNEKRKPGAGKVIFTVIIAAVLAVFVYVVMKY